MLLSCLAQRGSASHTIATPPRLQHRSEAREVLKTSSAYIYAPRTQISFFRDEAKWLMFSGNSLPSTPFSLYSTLRFLRLENQQKRDPNTDERVQRPRIERAHACELAHTVDCFWLFHPATLARRLRGLWLVACHFECAQSFLRCCS
jgi:hypothetical protein